MTSIVQVHIVSKLQTNCWSSQAKQVYRSFPSQEAEIQITWARPGRGQVETFQTIATLYKQRPLKPIPLMLFQYSEHCSLLIANKIPSDNLYLTMAANNTGKNIDNTYTS